MISPKKIVVAKKQKKEKPITIKQINTSLNEIKKNTTLITKQSYLFIFLGVLFIILLIILYFTLNTYLTISVQGNSSKIIGSGIKDDIVVVYDFSEPRIILNNNT